jgi:DNA-binding NarL/FixJ family response regulator
VKILICDDHKIVREGLRQILSQLSEITSIGEAGNGNEAFELLKKESYTILLLDISLPDKSGLDILHSVKLRWPNTNVLMLSMLPQEQYAIRALKLGASGYLTKDTASEELMLAVRKISAGGKYISNSLAEGLAIHLEKENFAMKHDLLSSREFEILIKIANGKPLQEIGNELFISVKTVSTYRSRIMEKMEMSRNTELARYCIENKLI